MNKSICLLVLYSVMPILAQNSIINGDFDTNVLSWSFTTPGTFTHNASLDADGDPMSGSGELANTSPVAFGTSFAAQCVNGIVAGNSYDFGARIRFDTSNTQTASGRANVVVSFFDGPNCSGMNLGGTTTSNIVSTTTDTWIQAEILGFIAPAMAVSAQVSLFTVKTEDTGTMTVNFDNAVFGPAGILPVELTEFSVD
ncbi:MAG: hypothetical protein KDC35_18605 [Acidobacteria bacterium]|nr:hypothetical protein [Acidobacteriota bacterium]